MAIALRTSSTFPLVIIHNRDEVVSRSTAPFGLQKAVKTLDRSDRTLLWGRDLSIANSAGDSGSWCGLALPTGRFAILTNARCAPTSCGLAWDAVVKPRCAFDRNGVLRFNPDRSRGALIRDYLLEASPWAFGNSAAVQYDGVNFITIENIFDFASNVPTSSLGATCLYSTNRTSCASWEALPMRSEGHDGLHVVANGAMDSFSEEPKVNRLRGLLQETLAELDAKCAAAPLLDASVMDMLGGCLCDRAELDVLDERVLLQSRPFHGAPEDELQEAFGVGHESTSVLGRWCPASERRLQRSIYTYEPSWGYQTRTQTVLAVHCSGQVLMGQRDTEAPDRHKPWTVFRIDPLQRNEPVLLC